MELPKRKSTGRKVLILSVLISFPIYQHLRGKSEELGYFSSYVTTFCHGIIKDIFDCQFERIEIENKAHVDEFDESIPLIFIIFLI